MFFNPSHPRERAKDLIISLCNMRQTNLYLHSSTKAGEILIASDCVNGTHYIVVEREKPPHQNVFYEIVVGNVHCC